VLPFPREGRGGLRFPLFGFPVSIHPSFLLIAVLIGFGSPNVTVGIVVSWTLVVLVSVLVHELGHAFVARGLGAKPTIDLYMLGGVTAFVPPRTMGRLQSIWVTLAGPLAGFLLGGFVLSVAGAFGVDDPSLRIYSDASAAEQVVSIAIYVNLVWGLVNLLPILPLDGGNVVRNLLPGTPEQRGRWAAIGSVVLAGALCIYLVQIDYARMMTLPLLLGAVNLHGLMSDRRQPAEERRAQVLGELARLDAGDAAAFDALRVSLETLEPEARERAKTTAVEILVRRGFGPEARRALAELPGTVHPSSYALVEIVDGSPTSGLAMIDDLFAAAPSPSLARLVLLARVVAGRGSDVPGMYARLAPAPLDGEVLRDLQHLAHLRGDYAGSVAIGEYLLSTTRSVDPWVLYNIACSSARLGDSMRALTRLHQAVDAGWSDARQLDVDQDLSSLWVMPEFRALRLRLAAPVTSV
jgi:stage IV sporulation protein FB